MSSPIRRIRERMPCLSQSDKPSKRIAHVVRILEDGQLGYAAKIGKPKRQLSRVDPFDVSRRQTKYTDYVGFITCIGQDDPDEYRVINNVVGPLTRGKCRFPWQSCILAGGIFMCNVPAFTPTASSGRLRRTAIFCMDVNLKPEESTCFPSMFKLTWLISSVVILVVDEKSYGKLKKALRELDDQTPKRPLAVVLFRSWEAQDKDGVKFTSWLTSHTDFMLSGDRDHESTLQAAEFLNDVAKIFETVSTCFMNSRDDIQPIIAEMVDSCKPLLWNNQAADLDNVNDMLTNILKSVNSTPEETLPAVASVVFTTVSSPTPPESKDLPKIVVKDFETLCDTYFSGAMDSIQSKDKDIQEVYKTSLRRCISKITREFPVYDTQEYESQFEEICKTKFQSFMSQLPVDVNDNSDGNDEAEIYKVPKSPAPVNLYDLVRLEFAKIELSLFYLKAFPTMRKSSSSLFGPQFGGNVLPKNTELRVFVQADGTLKVTDEPHRSSRRGFFAGCCGEGSSSKGYDDALCFVSCIGQTRGTQTRIINQISEEVSNGTSSFPVKKALQTAGGLISTKKPSSVTLGRRDQKWVTALHCVDLNTTIDEEQTYSSFVEFCYHISAAIIIVVDDASYDKILYALRRIPEIFDRKVTAAFVFLNWEAKNAVGQKFPCRTLMESSDFQNCADLNNPGTSEAFRLVAVAAMRFSKVMIGFSNVGAIDLKLPTILPFCEPLKWQGETSSHGDMYTILRRVANAVNKRYSTGAHNRAVIELPIASTRNRDITDDGDRNNPAATSRDIDQTVSSAQKVPSVAMSVEQPFSSNNGLQMQRPLSPNVPPPSPSQQPLQVAVKSTQQPQSPTVISVPHTQSPYTSHTPRPLTPTNVTTRPVSPAPSPVWSNPSAPPLAIQRPPILATIGRGSQAPQVSPPFGALTWLRQHGAFSRVQVALCAEFLSEGVTANNAQAFELPPEIKESQNTRNFKEAKIMYDLFLEDVIALRTAAQKARYDLSQILKTVDLTDASLTAQVNAVQRRVQNVQFKFKPEGNQLQKILAAVTDKMIGEFQAKCSLHFESQLLHINTVIDYVMKQYESFMKTATSESYFSDKQFKKMHEHILDQLEPKLTRLRGFETRQEELKNQFKELFKHFKEENRKRVRQFQREREGAIKNVLATLQVLNELFPGMDARELTEAGWEIFAIRVKDHPESGGKLYAEEVAAAIRDEVKDMTGNVDEDAVFCVEDFETVKGGGIFVPKCLENKLRGSLKNGDGGGGAITSKNDPQGGATEPELKRELEDLINRARGLMEQGPPMGSVMESYINKRIEEATDTLNLTGASNFKIRHAAEQLKIVIEKLE